MMTVGGFGANVSGDWSPPSGRRQLLVHDLDDLLDRVQPLQHLHADRALADAPDEVLDDLEVDVGFQQGQAHFTEGLADVLFGQRALAAQSLENGL